MKIYNTDKEKRRVCSFKRGKSKYVRLRTYGLQLYPHWKCKTYDCI